MLAHWEGEPVAVLQDLWGVPLLEMHGTLPSTNDRARELRAVGAPPFTVVLAEGQSAGRGRSGAPWVSEAGRGVWLSLLAPAPRTAGGGTVLPLLAGLAVARAIEASVPGVSAQVKWPNDVLVSGLKVAGVLCEGGAVADSTALAVVGIGVNVRPLPEEAPEEVRCRAGALEDLAGARVSRVSFTGRLVRACRQVMENASPTLSRGARADLEERDALRGLRVETDGGVEGVAQGMDEEGALLVRDPHGERHRIHAGRVVRAEGRPAVETLRQQGGRACTC